MNESMNFGDIGFGSVNSSSEQKVADNSSATNVVSEVNNVSSSSSNQENSANNAINNNDKIDFGEKKTVKKSNYERDADNFSSIEFGPLKKYLDDDDITDISYSNGGQLWLKSLSKGVYRADQQDVDNALMEKIAFQCSNIMGKTFNMAHPFLDSESAELRMNFVHDSIARNGIAAVFRKTPAKIRLEKNKLLNEKYVTLSIHDFLINCVKGHCNIIVCGETGSGKTELVKYLASHTATNEKIISIEDTLELHLDRIYPTRDIVAMKTNNIASYSDVLVTCMRQNPKWILLSEVRSAEAVTAVRNSISSGHNILSTIHADKAESIPHRMYSLLESNIDVEQFLKTIYRYVQIGVFVRGRFDPKQKRFVREIAGVTEFHVTDDNEAEFTNIYLKTVSGEEKFQEPSKYLKSYLEGQGIDVNNLFGENKSSIIEAEKIEKGEVVANESSNSEVPSGVLTKDDNVNSNNQDNSIKQVSEVKENPIREPQNTNLQSSDVISQKTNIIPDNNSNANSNIEPSPNPNMNNIVNTGLNADKSINTSPNVDTNLNQTVPNTNEKINTNLNTGADLNTNSNLNNDLNNNIVPNISPNLDINLSSNIPNMNNNEKSSNLATAASTNSNSTFIQTPTTNNVSQNSEASMTPQFLDTNDNNNRTSQVGTPTNLAASGNLVLEDRKVKDNATFFDEIPDNANQIENKFGIGDFATNAVNETSKNTGTNNTVVTNQNPNVVINPLEALQNDNIGVNNNMTNKENFVQSQPQYNTQPNNQFVNTTNPNNQTPNLNQQGFYNQSFNNNQGFNNQSFNNQLSGGFGLGGFNQQNYNGFNSIF